MNTFCRCDKKIVECKICIKYSLPLIFLSSRYSSSNFFFLRGGKKGEGGTKKRKKHYLPSQTKRGIKYASFSNKNNI